MPTFPQHRNLKTSSKHESILNTSDQAINLPAISDLLGSFVKKRRLE